MLRKVIYSLLIIICVIAATIGVSYVYRTEITHAVAKHYLDHYNAQLTCADWQWGEGLFAIEANRLCLSYQGHSLTLEGISLTFDALEIEKATVVATTLAQSNSADSQWQNAPLALLLPIKRPLLHIESASISYPGLARAMQFSISEQRLNRFAVSGDVNGEWALDADVISVDISMSDAFTELLLEQAQSLYQAELPWQASVTNLGLKGKFWGNRVDAQVITQTQVNVDSDEQCTWRVASVGRIALQSNDMHVFELDTSALTTEVALPQCAKLAQYTQHLGGLRAAKWQVNAVEPMTLDLLGNVSMPSLTISTQAGKESLSVLAKQSQLNWQVLSFEGEYALEAKISQYGSVTSQGQYSNANIAGSYEGTFKLPKQLALSVSELRSDGDFDYHFWGESVLSARVSGEQIKAQGLDANEVTANVDLKLTADGAIEGRVNTHFTLLNSYGASVENLRQTYDITGDIGVGRKSAKVKAQSTIARLRYDSLLFSDIKIDSNVTIARAIEGSHLLQWQGINALAKHNFDSNNSPVSLTINNTDLSAFTPLVRQLNADVVLGEGQVSLSANGDAKLQQFDWQLGIANADILYQSYLAKSLSVKPQGKWNSGQLHLQESTFTIDEVRAGPVLKHIKGQVGLEQDLYFADVTASVLDGTLTMDKMYVTGLNKQRPNTIVTLDSIDASKLVALEPQQGIAFKGILGASLPLRFDESGVSVENGRVYSQQPGKLTIDNNAAFNAVKSQQEQLGPMLGMLENLDIHDIQADVNLKSDGWLTMAMRIKGENPDHKQAVNFNYNHEENIYTLFKALRLSDEITKKVEREYQAKE
ncbi:YdbH domain-containing protein [Pseudoalteromonas pernae]|uniref:YdbH domain-containing protein n=1 Tax=Pseudoalteromonas pernae TaxID=3118054 RepID=UPI00324210C6